MIKDINTMKVHETLTRVSQSLAVKSMDLIPKYC